MARGFDQLSRRLLPSSEGLGAPPSVPGNSGPCPSSRGIDQISRATWAPGSSAHGVHQLSLPTWALLRWHVVLPAIPGESRSYPWNRGVDQLSRDSRERVQWSAVWTHCTGLLGLGSEGLLE